MSTQCKGVKETFLLLQVKQSAEVIVFPGCGPMEHAERIQRSVACSAIMTPLDGLIADADLEVKPLYMQRMMELCHQWVVADGVENPYTMLGLRREMVVMCLCADSIQPIQDPSKSGSCC